MDECMKTEEVQQEWMTMKGLFVQEGTDEWMN